MSSESPVQIGLQLHRAHDHGLFPAYFEYLPPQGIKGSATFVVYQFGSQRGTNCTYNIEYPLSITVQPGDLCSITLRVEHIDSPSGVVSRHLARFTYSERGPTEIETDGIDLRVYPEPPLVDELVAAFEEYAALYQKTHPQIAVPWYHGTDEQALDRYRRDPSTVLFGWLLGSSCNARFFGEQNFELELIEHCFRASQEQRKAGKNELMFPYWYTSSSGLNLLSPSAFIAEWKALRASFQKGHLS